MPTSIKAVAAALIYLGASPAVAACGASDQPMPVGALTGNPEKDTVGLVCGTTDVERTGSMLGAARALIAQVGASTGEAERDTFGYGQQAGAR